MVAPLKAIMPMYEPCAALSSAPAAGPSTSDLEGGQHGLVSPGVRAEKGRRPEKRETHGKERMLYSMPMRVPICLMSDICAMHGTMSALNAPLKKPYTAA